LSDVRVEVENMGGIGQAEIVLSEGVTIFTGDNATNRTSLLRAIAGGLGGEAGILKRDTERGSIRLSTGETEHQRRYVRQNSSVLTDGTPYTDETEIVDLFVSLLEENPIRRSVRAGEDIGELLLAPVDTEELESEIATLRSERERIDERLTEIEREQQQLPNLEQRRTELQDQLEDVESELQSVREKITTFEGAAAETTEAESLLANLKERQEELEEKTTELDTQRSIHEELQEQLTDVREQLSELTVQEERLERVEEEIEHLQTRESELAATVNDLSSIVKQNQNLLAGDESVITDLAIEKEVIDDLDPMSQSVECWTCGSQIARQAIKDQLSTLKGLVEKKREKRREVKTELSDLRSERTTLESEIERRRELKERETTLERELEERSELIEQLRTDIGSRRDDIAGIESKLESVGNLTDREEFDGYERVSELEYERGRLERDIQDVADEINEIEYLVGKRDDLEARRSNLTEQITSLRSRVEAIQQDIVEQFNRHMEILLERLEYGNIERVWLEGRDRNDGTTFPLHIAREDDDGIVYEDTIDHLSESEREVIGLVVALTGYVVHDVAERVPFILLDSLEAIDAARIAELVDHFSSETEYLLVALLEEDATELSESYNRIRAEETLI
jgi:predicted  nucleic acid-binding Zn-ribbon protein